MKRFTKTGSPLRFSRGHMLIMTLLACEHRARHNAHIHRHAINKIGVICNKSAAMHILECNTVTFVYTVEGFDGSDNRFRDIVRMNQYT